MRFAGSGRSTASGMSEGPTAAVREAGQRLYKGAVMWSRWRALSRGDCDAGFRGHLSKDAEGRVGISPNSREASPGPSEETQARYPRRAGVWMRSLHGGSSRSQSGRADAQGRGRDRRRRRSCCQPRSGAQTPACLVFRWRQNAVRAVDWRVLNESSGHYRRRFRWQARTESAPRARPFGAAVVVVILATFSLESAASQTLTHCAPRSC